LNKSVRDTRPAILELPCCSTHTSLSARDDENFLTTESKVSLGQQVWREEEEEEAWRRASSARRGVSRKIGVCRDVMTGSSAIEAMARHAPRLMGCGGDLAARNEEEVVFGQHVDQLAPVVEQGQTRHSVFLSIQ
jgi:hypothetical protein